MKGDNHRFLIVDHSMPFLPARENKPAAMKDDCDHDMEMFEILPQISKGAPFKRSARKTQNNEPCYCSSGIKYKKCCKLKT